MNELPTLSFVSPVGSALFAKLIEPDTKFKDLGEFSVSLIVPADEAAPLVKALDKLFEENIAFQADRVGKRKAKASVHRPYSVEYERDENGNETDTETGNIIFKFKRPHQVKRRKDGKIITLPSPALFDAGGTPCPGVEVGNGSTICIKGEARGWYNDSLGCGVKLDFSAVQVVKLREAGGGADSFSSTGFAVHKDGFSAKPEGDFAGDAMTADSADF